MQSQLISTIQKAYREEFNGNALDTNEWRIVQQGNGQTIGVTGSVMTIGAGTQANQETIIRNKVPMQVPFRTWFIASLSQRIANQEFYLEVVNDAGDMFAQWQFDGTVATNAKYGCGNGGSNFLSAAQTVTSTAGYTIFELELFIDETYFAQRQVDSLNSKTYMWCKNTRTPDPLFNYYLQIRVKNLGTAPATNTNLLLDAVAFQDITELTAEITGGRGGTNSSQSIPVYQTGGSATISGTPTIVGAAAHDAVISGSPVRIGARAVSANYATVASGDTADLITTLVGALIQKPYSIPENDWQFCCPSVVANTTDLAIKATAGAGLRNYITAIQLKNTNATATEVVLKDGSTVIWRGHLSANMTDINDIIFPTPLKTTANTALNFACITTGASVYVAAQGYVAP